MTTEEEKGGYYELPLGQLLWHLRLTERASQRVLHVVLEHTGVTKAQFGTLQVLQKIQRASSAALARTLTVSPQAMVGVISGLEKKGLIKRESNPSMSARVLVAEMTGKGERAFAAASRRFEILDAALNDALTPREQATLVRLLGKMRDVFEEVERSDFGKAP